MYTHTYVLIHIHINSYNVITNSFKYQINIDRMRVSIIYALTLIQWTVKRCVHSIVYSYSYNKFCTHDDFPIIKKVYLLHKSTVFPSNISLPCRKYNVIQFWEEDLHICDLITVNWHTYITYSLMNVPPLAMVSPEPEQVAMVRCL